VLKDLIFLTEDKRIRSEVNDFLEEWHSPSTDITLQTSGSTGVPKKILFKKEYLRKSAQKTNSTFSVEPEGSAFLCLSTQTIAGKMMIVRAIENKMTLYVGDVRSNALCTIDISSFDLMAIVPLQLNEALAGNPNLIKESKTVLVGGGPIHFEQVEALQKIKASVYHTYGMTETLSHVAYRKIGYRNEAFYTPLEGVELTEDHGCLVINYNELGIKKLKTTDTVIFDAQGKFRITGRADFTINSGGLKFQPEELEEKITHLITRPFFIGGIPDNLLGERIVLLIEGKKLEDDEQLLDQIKPLLPQFGCPKEIKYLSSFLRTPSLKIRRKETLKQQ